MCIRDSTTTARKSVAPSDFIRPGVSVHRGARTRAWTCGGDARDPNPLAAGPRGLTEGWPPLRGTSLGRTGGNAHGADRSHYLSLIHISEPTRQAEISYAVFCL